MRKMIVITVLFVLAGCSGNEQPAPAATPVPPQSGSAVSAIAELGRFATDSFAQMSFEFEGNPTSIEIQDRMDRALPMYGMETTNENRSQAGGTLVALRKEHGITEMEILDKMLAAPPNGAKFEEAATRIASGTP